MKKTGKFIISLDFELMWGVRDKRTTESYGKNILGVWEALPKMIEVFEKHQVKSTFAIVGFLFASTKEELLRCSPRTKPQYFDENLSPYNGHFDLIHNEENDKFHFASQLIQLLKDNPSQEIASHTFSHYYCLEEGQTKDDFKQDIKAAIKIAEEKGIQIKSLVFPRNQFNEEYLNVIKDLGITSYRGNEKIWFHDAGKDKEEKLFKRAFRLLDSYVNISGHNCSDIDDIKKIEPFNIPSSRFLRSFSPRLEMLAYFKLRRILKSMTYAAKNEKVFHLWWHPHNFGIHQKENFRMLEKILSHYNFLNNKYGFESLTMSEISNLLKR